MKIHYFQRYQQKENVDTANTMLLISRLYEHSPHNFYAFLMRLLPENAEVELSIRLQEVGILNGQRDKHLRSIPDAHISQDSFKIVVETKIYGNYGQQQLRGHISSFANENYKVLLTLDPNPMKQKFKEELDQYIRDYNTDTGINVIHKHFTFEDLIEAIRENIHDRDYEMQDILSDYEEYCYSSKLISDNWKRMLVRVAGTTIESNRRFNLYYCGVEQSYSGYSYLGLYDQKSVKLIGKICTVVTAITEDFELSIAEEVGFCTDEMRELIRVAIEDAKQYEWVLTRNRFFFVDEFFETDFRKTSRGPLRGTKYFDLCEVLDVTKLPSTEVIAQNLRKVTWEKIVT